MRVIHRAIIITVIIILSGCSSKDKLIKQLSAFNWITPIPQTEIRGRVTDKLSDKLIAGAIVFLGNTTFITQTDSAGNFYLDKVPFGNYDIYIIEQFYKPIKEKISVYGNVGNPYEIKIEHNDNKEVFSNFTANEVKKFMMKEKRGRLDKLNHVLFDPEFEKFTEIIIGKRDKCRLLNPEALNITPSRKAGPETITFTAEDPLYIINKYMGYEMLVILDKATLTNIQSYYYMKFDAAIAFKELPASDINETAEWIKNRVEAFTGSQRHFFAALIQNKLEEVGFTVFIPPTSSSNLNIGIPGSNSRGEAVPIPVFDLNNYLKPTVRKFEFEFTYPKLLQVNHLFKSPDYDKQKLYGNTKNVSTLISFQNKPVVINGEGNIVGEGTIYKTGFWTFQQLSDMIPADYVP